MAEETPKPAAAPKPPPAAAKPPAEAAAAAPAAAGAGAPAGGAKKGEKKEASLKLFYQALSQREKKIVRIAFIIISLSMLDVLIVRPMTQHLTHLNDQIVTQESVLPRRLLILKHKSRILREHEQMQRFVTDPNLSAEEEIAQFLREIERVTKQASLFVSNINPVKTIEKANGVYFLSVDLEGKGDFKQIHNFLVDVESSSDAMRISGFNLKPQSKDTDELKFGVTIEKLGVKKDSAMSGPRVDEEK